MPHGQFKDISLSEYRGKYTVFFFCPLDFTYLCPTEIIAFSNRAEEFKELNCQVIRASVISHFCHLSWINTPKKQGGLGPTNILLVSDPNRTIAQDCGALKADLRVCRSVDEILRLVHAFQCSDKYDEMCPAAWKTDSDTIQPSVQKSKEYFSKQK
ncbi:peroxiredoxin-1-like [Phodopus roborovskii]|uniref:peroxiredoxin-1-like n=1 Tax=Phodopus roborovskii TaxID=109678 RepID=UPI0021E4DD87|nr:peroxiredoxin-1-like [Phodopus roborovskii]